MCTTTENYSFCYQGTKWVLLMKKNRGKNLVQVYL
jgi:hypothetical protein